MTVVKRAAHFGANGSRVQYQMTALGQTRRLNDAPACRLHPWLRTCRCDAAKRRFGQRSRHTTAANVARLQSSLPFIHEARQSERDDGDQRQQQQRTPPAPLHLGHRPPSSCPGQLGSRIDRRGEMSADHAGYRPAGHDRRPVLPIRGLPVKGAPAPGAYRSSQIVWSDPSQVVSSDRKQAAVFSEPLGERPDLFR